jgi:enoyl-CoA hydratase
MRGSAPVDRRREDDVVLVERRYGVLLITLNRPEERNALDARVARVVAAAADELDASDDLRVGVLSGAGGTFSAGMDPKAFLRGERPGVEGRGLCGITITPPRKPLIGAVEGWALAGDFELLLAFDLVVAAETARMASRRSPARSWRSVARRSGCCGGSRMRWRWSCC